MKVLRTLIISILFLTCYNLQAQFINSFTAEQGFQAALNYASQTDGLSNPVLLGIGTQNQTIEILGGQEITIGIDIANGESNGWIYLFGDEGTSETSVAAVVNVLGSYQAVSPPAGTIEDLPFDPTVAITSEWTDSDDMVTAVKGDARYNAFMQNNPQTETNTAALYINEFDDFLELNKPYWILTFGVNDDLVCFTQAENRNTICFDVETNVKEVVGSFLIGPNPAQSVIRIENKTNETINSILFINNSGKVVYQSNKELLDVSEINSGSYIMLIRTDKNLYKKKINIVN